MAWDLHHTSQQLKTMMITKSNSHITSYAQDN